MSERDTPETITLEGEELSLEEVADRMEASLDEQMTDALRADIVERLRELLALRCAEHGEPPELVQSDEKGLRVETCCHALMDRVNEVWSA